MSDDTTYPGHEPAPAAADAALSPPPRSSNAAKVALRREFKARRKALQPADTTALNREITRRVLELPDLLEARTVFSYITIQNEADTRPVIAALLEAGIRVVTPPVDQAQDAHRAVHFVFPGDPALAMPQPRPVITPDTTGVLGLSDVDVFLVPGIVWDARGYRIGFGGGYFDWLLSQARPRAMSIGLAYEWQVVPEVPADPWDVPVGHIITESRFIDCASARA